MARPGEFSERAFLNGKIDIAQAEAVADLIDAGTAAAGASRGALHAGRILRAHRPHLHALLTELRVHVEAAIDFPDEEIDFLSAPAISCASRDRCSEAFDSIEAAARQGALLREGLTVVIAGKPNAGKSSLLNALAGDEVAIVTPAPGTTRDVLRQQLHLDGLPLNLVDTAGLRAAADAGGGGGHPPRARARCGAPIGSATLWMRPSKQRAGRRGSADELPEDVPVTLIHNKIDLTGEAPRVDESASPPRIFLSARTGAGIDLLRAHLQARAGYRDLEAGVFAARRRHLDALARARVLVGSAAQTLAREPRGRALRRGLAARAGRLGRDHGRGHQRGFAGRNLRKLLHRQVSRGAIWLFDRLIE